MIKIFTNEIPPSEAWAANTKKKQACQHNNI
jgi:hypothetical protein